MKAWREKVMAELTDRVACCGCVYVYACVGGYMYICVCVCFIYAEFSFCEQLYYTNPRLSL